MEKNMKEKRVLIYDRKKVFFKMFQKKISQEFAAYNNILVKGDNEPKFNDHLILVIYDKMELATFLNLYRKRKNVLICIFDNELFFNLMFFHDVGNLFLVDGTKIKSELLKDLKLFLNSNVTTEEHRLQLQNI